MYYSMAFSIISSSAYFLIISRCWLEKVILGVSSSSGLLLQWSSTIYDNFPTCIVTHLFIVLGFLPSNGLISLVSSIIIFSSIIGTDSSTVSSTIALDLIMSLVSIELNMGSFEGLQRESDGSVDYAFKGLLSLLWLLLISFSSGGLNMDWAWRTGRIGYCELVSMSCMIVKF